jgi:hypothetical protein
MVSGTIRPATRGLAMHGAPLMGGGQAGAGPFATAGA